MQPVQFFAHSDIAVIGSNPENADYDNPRGFIYGMSAYVVAEDAKGFRVRLHVKTAHRDSECLPAAERVASALNARLAAGKLPVAFGTWEETFPAYGSEAYSNEEAVAWERSLEEF